MSDLPSADPPPRQRVALTGGWPSLKEFIEWTEEDPEGLSKWEQVAQRFESGQPGNQTPELHEAVAEYLLFRKQKRAVDAVKAESLEIIQITQAPPGSDPEGV